MEAVPIISQDYKQRLATILDAAWRIFQSQFICGRYLVTKEAPFQFHFANVLNSLGNLYCLSREGIFAVDLETKLDGVKGKTKYIDITCAFLNADVSCAIELKYKTAKQGAQDHGRIDAYTDIEAVEIATQKGYDLGRFFMITDSSTYLYKSTKGVGTVFAMHEGHTPAMNLAINYTKSKGREHVSVNFRKKHTFHWEHHEQWHFLAMPI